MVAEDIMKRDVVTIRENQTVRELAQLLLDRRITGVPVLDKRGKLAGVVSQTDLVRSVREHAEPRDAPAYHQELDRWLGRQGFQVEAPDYELVRDVMTPGVICADPDTPVEDLARMMAAKHIHRILITRGGKVAGIVTSMDILEAFVSLSDLVWGAKA